MDVHTRCLVVILYIFFTASQTTCQDNFYFSSKPENRDVVEGSEIVLYCDVSNRNQIAFDWIQSGKPIKFTSRKFQEGRNLRILRVTRDEDKGPFQCIATNYTSGYSTQSNEAVLNIQWIDDIAEVELKRPKAVEVKAGADILLVCKITGNPEPTYIWYQNKFRLFNTDRIRTLERGTKVRISNVTAKENGIYSCRAENVAGAVDSSKNFLLNVKGVNTPYLIESQFTESLLVMKHTEARLDCPFSNARRIDWFFRLEKISNSSRHMIYSNGSLYFPRVRLADEGSYRCEGLGSHRQIPAQAFTAELNIAYLKEFSMSSFEPRLIANFPIVMPMREKFIVKVFPPDGQPPPMLRWLDRSDLVIGPNGNIHVEGNNLVFENPQELDSGNYTVILRNMAGEKRQNVWIIVSVPPIISRGPREMEAEEDGTALFNCQVTGTEFPVTSIIWKKDGNYIKMGSIRHHIDKANGTLIISDVKMRDAGTYACVANTTGHPLVTSSLAYLRVKKKLKFSPMPRRAHILLGEDSSVPCRAEGDGPVRIHWVKNGQPDSGTSRITVDGTMQFINVQRSDEGWYTCIASSQKQGSINMTIYIDVVELPKFQISPQNLTVHEGQPVMLHCVAIGDPKPDVNWDKNYFRDFDFSRIKFFTNGTLSISRVYMEDKGRYGCTANNTAGKTRREAFLNVASTSYIYRPENGSKSLEFHLYFVIFLIFCARYLH